MEIGILYIALLVLTICVVASGSMKETPIQEDEDDGEM